MNKFGYDAGGYLAYIRFVGRMRIFSATDMSTGFGTADSPVTLFTVTGDVQVKVWAAVQGTAVASALNTATLSIGTVEAPQGIIVDSTVNGTQFAVTDVWVDASPAQDVEALPDNWFILGGGANIILTIGVEDITAGALEVYCLWSPLSSNGNVV